MLNREFDRHKKLVLVILLKITIVAGFVFSFLNYQRNQTLLACIELITALVSLWIYYHVRRTHAHNRIKRLALIYTIFFFSIMMFAFSTKGSSNSIFIWAYAIPMISYLLLGIRTGFIMTAAFYTVAAILLFDHYNINGMTFEKVTIANIVFSALVFWGLSHTYESANFLAKEKLRKMAIYDKLTGLYNRTMLDTIFVKSNLEAQNQHQKIALLAFDLDLFKEINDQFGHVIGDEVLKAFSKMLNENIPDTASAFRLGGEEFAVILACPTVSYVKELAELVRKQTENISINTTNSPVAITVSVGIAINVPENANLANMLKLSDKHLYQAKRQGRNMVISE